MAEPTTNANGRRRRTSQLLQAADSLPSIENSLDEFIARANSTLVDAANWDSAEKNARAENDQQREADQLRWRAAEHQLRESEAKAGSLRRQLDGLQGQLAEAEARAAVGSTVDANSGALAALEMKLARIEERALTAEDRTRELENELEAAKAAPALRPSLAAISELTGEDPDYRVRVAEAKATKALAAARAAAAGLRVSAADIAAIESGLVLDEPPAAKSTPWLFIVAAFMCGLAIMFVVGKLMFDKGNASNAAPAVAAPAGAPSTGKPIVTPIETAAPAPAAAPAPDTAAAQPAPAPAPAPVVAAPAPVEPAPAPVAPPPVAPAPKAVPAKHAAAPAKHAAKPAAGGLADPFGGDASNAKKPAAKPAAKPDAKKPAGLVDPF